MTRNKENHAGGDATASGINFQAAVTALIAVYIVRGRPLGWLEGLIDDVPISLLAETRGPGDDVQVRYSDGSLCEVQVKRRLNGGRRLWDSLVKLAKGIQSSATSYGVIVVSSDSSDPVKNSLSRDIKRIADGRTDGLSKIGAKLCSKLEEAQIPASVVCGRLRIVVVNAQHSDDASIRAARAELEHLCRQKARISQAWDRLYRDATDLIELRGQRNTSSIVRILRSAGVEIGGNIQDSPGTIVATLAEWVYRTSATFSILGLRDSLSIDDSWIPLRAAVQSSPPPEETNLAEALKRYHAWHKARPSPEDIRVDSQTLGRFIRHVVVVAGPGMGKSTLMTVLARRYAESGLPVARVRLSVLAARMRNHGFTESLVALALDGSGLSAVKVERTFISDWVLLCDGLDECAYADQERIAEGLLRFVAGHDGCRVIVTTRPIGYGTSLLRRWRHYDLVPLDANDLKTHLARLGCLTEKDIDEAIHDLKTSSESEVIARSPLLLGIVASLIVRNKVLGRTKAQLYEKMFDLIDDLSNSRVSRHVASRAVLRRFLDFVGWILCERPLAVPYEIISSTTEWLREEMGYAPLLARETAEQCLRYWLDVGVLERVQSVGQEALTFVHRTFAEFTAARYLLSLHPDPQASAISGILNEEDRSEILTFAGSLGLATSICAEMLSRDSSQQGRLQMTARALAVISEGEVPAESEVLQQAIERGFLYVRSDRRVWGLTIGPKLVALAERFPKQIAPPAAALLDSEQAWTCLAAWGCVVAAGPSYYDLNRLMEMYKRLPMMVGTSVRGSLLGGMVIDIENKDLTEEFAYRATKEILERCPSDEADEIVKEVLNALNCTVGFVDQMSRLFNEKERKFEFKQLRSLPPIDWVTYFKARDQSWIRILSVIDDASIYVDRDPTSNSPHILLDLSAFISISGFWESPVSDVWAWDRVFDESAVKEVLRGIVGVAGIDNVGLVRDARALLGYLRNKGEQTDGRLFEWLARLDTPEIQWDRAKSIGLDIEKLEAALHHKSEWLVPLAANLLFHAASRESLRPTVVRILASGKDLAIWAASQMVKHLPAAEATTLIYDRLRGPLVPGCEYLFDLLKEVNAQFDEELFSVLKSGLINGFPEIAVSAAELALQIADITLDGFKELMVESFSYWRDHEEPYPVKGGRVPLSPREKLLSALVKINAISDEGLIATTMDVRSDVSRAASDEVLQRLLASEGIRESFTCSAVKSQVSASFLRDVLRARVPFKRDQIERLRGLLSTDDPKLRYAALGILNSAYLERSEIESGARIMAKDPEPQISEAAQRLIEGGN